MGVDSRTTDDGHTEVGIVRLEKKTGVIGERRMRVAHANLNRR